MSSPTATLQVLLVEDSDTDAVLTGHALNEGSGRAELTRVEDRNAMEAALAARRFDVVLTDNRLPDFSATEALETLRASGQDIPLIVVTGTLQPDDAVQIVVAGADDYVLKSDLPRLSTTVERALEARQQRRSAAVAEHRAAVLQQAVEQTESIVIVTDAEGRIDYVNPRFTEVSGYPAAEVMGRNPRFLGGPNTPPQLHREMWRTIVGGDTWRGEFTNRRRDGSDYIVSTTVSPVRDAWDTITHYVAIQEDVTAERRDAEHRRILGRLREHFLQMSRADELDIALDGFCDEVRALGVDFDLCLVTRFEGETDDEADDEAAGPGITTQIDPASWSGALSPALAAGLRQVWQTGRAARDTPDLAPALAHLGPVRTTVDLPFSQGTVTFARAAASPFDDDELEVLGHMVSVLSFGYGRHADLVALEEQEEQLRRSQRMESIGQLAGGVAHDFNNLLTVITGHAQVLRRRHEPGTAGRDSVEHIVTAADRAANLVGQLLAFGRRQVLQPEILDLNAVVDRLHDMLTRLIGEDVELVWQPGDDLGRVSADPTQVEQVVLNLVVNARDAMPEGGRLVIETCSARLDADFASHDSEIKSGEYAMVAVTDSGLGMDRETQARVFEPFFTTKGNDRGTGLGLATVYGIVKQSGGYIWAYSEPGQGTTFKVYLPLVDSAAPTALEPEPARAAPVHGTGRVLLVEDEDMIRELAEDVLAEAGFEVLTAHCGERALEVAADEPVDLLVTDLVMPGMDGVELATRLRRERPELPVLFTSGYGDHSVVSRVPQDGRAAFLTKPFSPDQLVDRVAGLLAETSQEEADT